MQPSPLSGVHGVVPNVTPDQLRQLQKLDAVGRLAGGVAHDFNNLLTVILGCCQMLQAEHAADSRSGALLKEIQQAGERAARLTRQLLLFSRKQRPETSVFSLNTVISGLASMLQRLIGDHILMETDLEPQLWPVCADLGQAEQVVLNLVVNARDAMPKGGRLRIETRNQVVTPGAGGENANIPAGPWATLVVRDTGCGMSEEVLAHLFEPFFTTKGPDKGTGLGLATVYGIITQSGGHIRVASKKGVGTRFRVFLPRTTQPAAAEPAAPPPRQPGWAGKGTILLVEDEPSLRKMAALALQGGGYTVLEAAHGGEALAVAAARQPAIDLVVTDVIMPILTGPQLAAKLLSRCPGLKVLYTSGYTDSLLAPHNEQDIRSAFLQKPFTPTGLLGAVERLLTTAN